MTKWIAGILGTVIGGLMLAYALNLFGPQKDGPDPRPPIDESNGTDTSNSSGKSADTDKPVVMGALEIGTNRQGFDFDAFGKPAGNAELCAEMCRADKNCDAMTYVKSTGVCWLKNGVPAASADADMVSAIKVQHNS